ncbi:MAG: trypsin-like peptidase domain-containing protein [Clostridia bacterium]|nr:trypsin-like peptidase domain-containing protein [Clostridia bacterium]
MRKIAKLLILAVMTVMVSLSAVGCQFVDFNSSHGGNDLINSIVASSQVEFNTIEETERQKYSLPEAVEKVERTSVAIEVTSSAGSGAGSGVIIDVVNSNNYVFILTCHHVISTGGEIVVRIPDQDCNYENDDYVFSGVIGNQIYKDQAVTLVGGDRVSDIAVIKINLDLPATSGEKLSMDKIQKAKMPSAEYEIKKGESIFAIGNPGGTLPGSVADGVVSYPEREVIVGDVGYMDLMQISVTTNPGNSGGGLYNLYGELIGITNAGNTNYSAINWAIPIELESGNGFLNVASQLIATANLNPNNYGYVSDRWEMGFTVETKTSGVKAYILVKSVVADSNADKAGLKEGDILESISFEGKNYTLTMDKIGTYVGMARTKLKKGDTLSLFIVRSDYFNSVSKELKMVISVADYIFCDTGK